ncbi:MAG: InlB B-repeat-containing protein [Lachnospiraceae bacterium]|nr:InlB B-repeat-containing protein [Lachnospiraceae bacterium]
MSSTIDPTPDREEKSRQSRRYGLFGVSSTGGMSESQRTSMARWATAFVVIMAVAFLALVVFGSNRASGLTVSFDSQGGSEAVSQSVQYGETIGEPENVVRVGYTLTGWSLTPDGEQLWDFASDTVEENLTLYAVWEAQ